MDINEARSPTDEMQALVLAGVDGYCFIEKDAKVDPRAGSHAPKVVLCEPFITNQAGSLSSLTSHPGALPGRMVREDVLAQEQWFPYLVPSGRRYLPLVGSSPASVMLDAGKANVAVVSRC